MRYAIAIRRLDGEYKSDVTGQPIIGWHLFCNASSKKKAEDIANTLVTKSIQAQITDKKTGHKTLIGVCS